MEALSAKGLLPDPGDKGKNSILRPSLHIKRFQNILILITLSGGIQDESLASGSVVSSPLSESSPTDTHKRKDSKWKSMF